MTGDRLLKEICPVKATIIGCRVLLKCIETEEEHMLNCGTANTIDLYED